MAFSLIMTKFSKKTRNESNSTNIVVDLTIFAGKIDHIFIFILYECANDGFRLWVPTEDQILCAYQLLENDEKINFGQAHLFPKNDTIRITDLIVGIDFL